MRVEIWQGFSSENGPPKSLPLCAPATRSTAFLRLCQRLLVWLTGQRITSERVHCRLPVRLSLIFSEMLRSILGAHDEDSLDEESRQNREIDERSLQALGT